MILEKFYTTEYDKNIVLIKDKKNITFSDLKKYVYCQKNIFEKEAANSVVLLGDDSFEFIVNFFAAIFAKKNIYLLTDKNRLSMLNFDYIIPEKPEKAENYNFEQIDVKNTFINLFTSGSTSMPKMVKKNFFNLEEEAKSLSQQFTFEKNELFYSTTIMAHMFGLIFQFILPMYMGNIINTEKVEFPEQITDSAPYILISSPSFLEKMAKYNVGFNVLPKKIFTAGDKLKENVYQFFKTKSDIIEIYGSTEVGTIAYRNDFCNFKCVNGVIFYISDDGCIVVKSDFFIEDEMKIGDIAEKLSDTEFILKGRSDRIVKIKEKRISLEEIENILKQKAAVIDAYCFKYQDVLACAIVTSDSSLNEKILKEYLLKYSEIVPKKWRFIDEVPKTKSGKTDRVAIEQIFSMNLSYPFIFSRKQSEKEAELGLFFRKNSNFFKGHFSIMPVLPGVVQLFYANYFAKKIFKTDIPVLEAKKIKFSSIIKADEQVMLKLTKKESSVEFTYMADDKVCSSGIFVL